MNRTALIGLAVGLLTSTSACDGAAPQATPKSAITSSAPAPGTQGPAQASESPVATASANAPRPSGAPSRVEERTFASPSLGVSKRYEVYLPAGYDGSTLRFPVIYMLHGLGGNETNWLKHGDLKQTADTLALQAIVVMPDGDAGFYVNSAPSEPYQDCLGKKALFDPSEPPESYCVKTPHYEDYIVKDLIQEVDGHYRTIAAKASRGIGGLSMGGFGALELAFRHTDTFGAVASHSGLVSLMNGGAASGPGHAGGVHYVMIAPDAGAAATIPPDALEKWGRSYPKEMREHLLGIFGRSTQNWQDHDPVVLASRLGADAPKIYIDCGTEDDFKFQEQAGVLDMVLKSKGIDHELALVPGHHSFDLWKARLPESLRFFAKSLRS